MSETLVATRSGAFVYDMVSDSGHINSTSWPHHSRRAIPRLWTSARPHRQRRRS
jgi:hypothetical protein